ncbi:NAD(P)-dependent alcohol dehydrogenase [Nonomuraea zeae]|uniref:NAD(P)-dependent alcohol dehydrogenase n=2 Tax=Nonomuraea zeae TaxID=1642303 RepID=A0A5S4GTK5_9ACTN|nr:NAD(P)-dependent alcohol dehydrogenase [Nonomuraea zeae]
MKAVRFYAYGPPEVLQIEETDVPAVGDDEVLVRVRAAAVNPLDWHGMRGAPYVARLSMGLARPKVNALGNDVAGRVEAVGRNVIGLRPGDEVYGGSGVPLKARSASFAEYAIFHRDDMLLTKPAGLTFTQAAAVAMGGLTALQGLRDKGRIRPGHRVLVNGAAGGVGTFAVQLAKALGAEVTGVCSTPNVELVRSLGADHVIDYTKEDYTRAGKRYDIVLDLVANRTITENRRVLVRKGVLVECAPFEGLWLGPVLGMLKLMALSRIVPQRLVFFLAQVRRDDLAVLGELLESGKIAPVIDRTYALDQISEAVAYVERGHARGKVVITV